MSWIARGQAYREPVTPPEAPGEKDTWTKITQTDPYPQGDTARDNVILTAHGDPARRAAPPPPDAQTSPHTLTPAHRQTAAQRDRQMAATQQDAYRDQ